MEHAIQSFSCMSRVFCHGCFMYTLNFYLKLYKSNCSYNNKSAKAPGLFFLAEAGTFWQKYIEGKLYFLSSHCKKSAGSSWNSRYFVNGFPSASSIT